MSNAKFQTAVQSCTDVTNRFYHNLDRNNHLEVAKLFAEDGVWVRHDGECRGREAILAVFKRRPKTVANRHLVSNIVVDIENEDVATVYYEISVVVQDGDDLFRNVAILSGKDKLQAYDEGWKIRHKQVVKAFPAG